MGHALAEQHFSNFEEVGKWLDEWFAAKDKQFFWHEKNRKITPCCFSDGGGAASWREPALYAVVIETPLDVGKQGGRVPASRGLSLTSVGLVGEEVTGQLGDQVLGGGASCPREGPSVLTAKRLDFLILKLQMQTWIIKKLMITIMKVAPSEEIGMKLMLLVAVRIRRVNMMKLSAY
ncbi:hypothetical protein P5V15_012746 [Pogonomyrmex californicus]